MKYTVIKLNLYFMVHSNVWNFEKIWLSGTLIIIRKPKVSQTDERTWGSLYTPDINMKDINKGTLQMQMVFKWCEETTHFCGNMSMKLLEVSPSCLHFSLMFSEGEVKSPCFLKVWWALNSMFQYPETLYCLLISIPEICYGICHCNHNKLGFDSGCRSKFCEEIL
jgi:hypothetical protein